MSEENSTNNVRRDAYVGIGILVTILLLGVVVTTTVGFGPFEAGSFSSRSPTLWDWLELLIVPTVLALGAFWLNKSQKVTELHIAAVARETDREIASNRQHQATLEAYYDRMTDLLIEHGLRVSTQDSEVRSIARARTIAALRSLDSIRNEQLFAFLIATAITHGDMPIITFREANLSGIDLAEADLPGVTLSKAILASADLRGANLRKARLEGVDLSNSRLSRADLSGAILRKANMQNADMLGIALQSADLANVSLVASKLTGASCAYANLTGASMAQVDANSTLLYRANLNGANLSHANLIGSDFRGASLTKADLSNADLSQADLSSARLSETVLNHTNLSRANLAFAILSSSDWKHANLTGADLRGAKLDGAKNWCISQLEQAKVLERTIMPDGIELGALESDWTGYIEGPTFEEWKSAYLIEHRGTEESVRDLAL